MKNEELLLIGGLVVVIGGIVFWKDISKFLTLPSLDMGSGMYQEEEDMGDGSGSGGMISGGPMPDFQVEMDEPPVLDRYQRYRDLAEPDYGTDEKCKIDFTSYANYYATRVAEELDKHNDDLRKNQKLEIKGRVLMSYKDEINKMYKLNKKCVKALKGESRAIFIDVILRTADRMNIYIPEDRKADWKRLVAEELNKKSPKSVFAVTKISVM